MHGLPLTHRRWRQSCIADGLSVSPPSRPWCWLRSCNRLSPARLRPPPTTSPVAIRLNAASRLVAHYARRGSDLDACGHWTGVSTAMAARIGAAPDFATRLAISRVYRAAALYHSRRRDPAAVTETLGGRGRRRPGRRAPGRAMLEALIGGERDPDTLTDLALAAMRRKRGLLAQALTGRFAEHHAFLARTCYPIRPPGSVTLARTSTPPRSTPTARSVTWSTNSKSSATPSPCNLPPDLCSNTQPGPSTRTRVDAARPHTRRGHRCFPVSHQE
jgi:hypothetical protein